MSPKYRVLGLMTSAQAGASVMQQSLGVLAPFVIADYGLSKEAFGAVFTAMFLGSTACTAMSGVLTDQLGERRMVIGSAVVMALALLAVAAHANYAWLVVWMTIFGAGYAAATPAGGRAILAWFDRDRGVAMGVRQTGVPLGGLIGALVLPFVAAHFGGYRAGFVVAAMLLALPTLAVYAFYRESDAERLPTRKRDLARGMVELARDPRLIAVTLTCMVLVNVQVAMNGFLTITAIQAVGIAPANAAIVFAAAFAIATGARLFWGWVSDRFVRDRVVLLGALCVLAAPAALALGLLRPASAALFAPAALWLGLAGAGWNGVMATALAEIGGAARAGSALGLTLTAIFATSAVGPLAFGAIADRHSLETAWIATAVVTFAGVLPALWLAARGALHARAESGAAAPRWRNW